MAKCNDCWCEYYDKSKGNCDKCVKSESEIEKTNLSILLNRRVVKKIELGKKSKAILQDR